ncbi:MAG: hypothetical protein K6T37_02070 [Acidothermus cellulolyticus]|nr:hypothetical protein [Acidothermus cellulolyticus]
MHAPGESVTALRVRKRTGRRMAPAQQISGFEFGGAWQFASDMVDL